MRLHRLEVEAFGPFADRAVVDFDAVGAAGLFLIHGATGSGKSSLLDAICFALFADVPGARTKRGLASHHAQDGVAPSVLLEFTTSGRRFRVRRTPEFERSKKRGTGLLRVTATVVLQEHRGGSWSPVSTRHDEVAHLLDEVLGMGLTQFAKVVVLPQGDVAAFLRASPEDRRALLERLFDISVFTDVEQWLVEERRRTAADLTTLTAAAERQVGRLHDLLDGARTPPWSDLPLEDVPAALAEYTARLGEEVLELLAAAAEAETHLGVASGRLTEATGRAAARARGFAAEQARTRAAEQAGAIAELKRKVDRAAAAEALTGHLSGLVDARADEERSGERLRTAQEALADSGLAGTELGDRTGADLAGLADLVHTFDAGFSRLEHTTVALARHREALEESAHAVREADRDLAEATSTVTEAEQAVATLTGRIEAAAPLADDLETATRAAEDAARALTLAEEISEIEAVRTSRMAALITARESVLTAQERVIDLRRQRLEGMAAELAAGLSDDDPCPVCGSVEHPAPAPTEHLVDPAELADAEEVLTGAASSLRELEQGEAARDSRLTTLGERLAELLPEDGPRDVDRLAAFAQEASERREAALAASRSRTTATAELKTAGAVLAAAETARATAESLLAAATARTSAEQSHITGCEEQIRDLAAAHAGCPCHTGNAEDADEFAEQVLEHRRVGEALDELVSARLAREDASARRAQRERSAVSAAHKRGFATLEEVAAAAVDASGVTAMQARVADHEQALAVAAATLAEPAVREALAAGEPDLAAAAEAEAAARRAALTARGSHASAEARLAMLHATAEPLTETIAQLQPLRERATAVKELADAATGVGGGNVRKMRLSAFVLAARLEKVVALANERLQTMDAGRYLLEHSDARVGGNVRSGLDLRVLDQWTGRTRETSSLSGGESFMVSLALALGLADAVREEAGGFDLGTLFVDEGFGSLDEDSLEHVMGVLDGLREGGRAVGVVSHVHDLRGRISHQVVVHKAATGSSVSVRTAATPAA